VHLICEAADLLKEKGVNARAVSVLSMEVFEEQDGGYKEAVLPAAVRARLAVEAAASFGWHKYTGLDGGVISIDTFGASGPAGLLFKQYGFTVENIVEKAMNLLRK
jgi:transketolase